MKLPSINILFKNIANTVIKRSSRGIVACIIKDSTAKAPVLQRCSALSEVDFTLMLEANYEYIRLLFEVAPSSVIIVRVQEDDVKYQTALETLKDLKWNYLTIPGIESEQTSEVVAWIKEQRDINNKIFKAVLPKTVADHEGVINCTIDNVTTKILDKKVSCAAYCARIASILATVPLSQSSTYYILQDIVSMDLPKDPDALVGKGELIAIYDGEKFKIGRGVNSFTTTTDVKGEDFKKIKIIEGKDQISSDIRTLFEDAYIGKVRNSYDNKQMFVAAINNYYRDLEGDVLDPDYENICQLDIEATKKYLTENSVDFSTKNDDEILRSNTGSHLFLKSSIKEVDAMEDLEFVNYM